MSNYCIRFPGGRKKALTLSYDDAVEQDIRLMQILDKHGIKCTFNINTGCFAPEGMVYEPGTIHRRLSKKQSLELYTNSGHEVAVHALTHPHLERMTAAEVAYEIMTDKSNIERDFSTITRGMAYPFGTYNDEVVRTLESCGIVYSRTTKCTEGFGIPADWLRLEATCHHKNPRLTELCDKFLQTDFASEPGLFYMWGHSYEFDMHDNWEVIECFAEKMGGREDIWYATNIEIYDYCKAYEQLIFSSDSSLCYNPTAFDLYFGINDKVLMVKSGETVHLKG